MAPERQTVHSSSRGEALSVQGLAGTPGGTRIPNLLIRSQTTFVPRTTTESLLVMSCRGFSRLASRLVPASHTEYHGVGSPRTL